MIACCQQKSDAAAICYLRTCLDGRANRLRRKWKLQMGRELLAVRELDVTSASSDKVDNASDQNWEHNYRQITDRMALDKAMSTLTARETALILELFWMQKTVTEVCGEYRVSKNSILKMKRNALGKMRRALKRMV